MGELSKPVVSVTMALLAIVVVTMTLLVTIATLVEEMISVTDIVGGADKHFASIGRSDSNVATGICDW